MSTHAMQGLALNEENYLQVLSHFATGVVAVTGLTPDGGPSGMTVSSFTSVSMEPRLVSFCIGRTSRTWPVLRESKGICVNILAEQQKHVSARLARSGERKFSDITWLPSPSGFPVLSGVLAWIEGAIEAEHRAGDHDIIVVGVRSLGIEGDLHPLVRFRGAFHRLQLSIE
ncbi:flavin reductase family protein [Streptomyces coeruleorubidus]|uniref:flavin reductase family protein n=1 Tax=Streptomyces coeruleorubidus TaxID=116188 RepID=UPI0033DCFC9D